MYLVPELAAALRANTSAYTRVQEVIAEYEEIAPYWFVTRFEGALGEGTLVPLHDHHAMFHARAWILEESPPELLQYLDVPAFAVGDLSTSTTW
jgi:hypothetical protein